MPFGPFPNANSIDLIEYLALRELEARPDYGETLTAKEADIAGYEQLAEWSQEALVYQENLLGIKLDKAHDSGQIILEYRSTKIGDLAKQARQMANVDQKPLNAIQQELQNLSPGERSSLESIAIGLVADIASVDVGFQGSDFVIFPENLNVSAARFPYIPRENYQRWRLHHVFAERLLRQEAPQLYEDMIAASSRVFDQLTQPSDPDNAAPEAPTTTPVSADGITPEPAGSLEAQTYREIADIVAQHTLPPLVGHQYLFFGFISRAADEGVPSPHGIFLPMSVLIEGKPRDSTTTAGRLFAAEAINDLGWNAFAKVVLDPDQAPSPREVLANVERSTSYQDWLERYQSGRKGITP